MANDPIRLNLARGVTFGSYRIEERLGEGGMGVVYRAADQKLNRTVAIKFLSSDFADFAARRRFQLEAQTASSLNHPHILTVHDVGEFEGRQYIVTEFIDGGTLKDWAEAGKPTWRQVVELLIGVADGLAAAHAAGIIHRDIKPEHFGSQKRLREARGLRAGKTRRAVDGSRCCHRHAVTHGNDPRDRRLHVTRTGFRKTP